MCECQGNPLARVTLPLGLPYLLVNRALKSGTEYSGFKPVVLQKWSLRFATDKYKIKGKYLKPIVKLAAKESKSGIDHIVVESWESHVTQKPRGAKEPNESSCCMFSLYVCA